MVVRIHNVDFVAIEGDIIAILDCYFVPTVIASHNSIVEGLMVEFKRTIQLLEAFKKKVYELKIRISTNNIR